MKSLLITSTMLLSAISGFSQLQKGNFLLGGSGSYSRHKMPVGEFSSINRQSLYQFKVSGGYFVLPKLAVGLGLGYDGSGVRSNYLTQPDVHYRSSNASFVIEPFARYYLLSESKKINIFPELSTTFQFAHAKSDGSPTSRSNQYTYKAGVGAALFLNENVALEAIARYNLFKSPGYDKPVQALQFSGGFNIHLGKSKTVSKDVTPINTDRKWILGGSFAANRIYNPTVIGITTRATTISGGPIAGYFFTKRLVGGLKLDLSLMRSKWEDSERNFSMYHYSTLSAIPFARFYLMDPKKKFNVFPELQAGYSHGISKTSEYEDDGRSWQYRAGIGGSVLVTKSVAVELIGGYERFMQIKNDYKYGGPKVSLGFSYFL